MHGLNVCVYNSMSYMHACGEDVRVYNSMLCMHACGENVCAYASTDSTCHLLLYHSPFHGESKAWRQRAHQILLRGTDGGGSQGAPSQATSWPRVNRHSSSSVGSLCVCVCVCVRARARVRVRPRVRMCLYLSLCLGISLRGPAHPSQKYSPWYARALSCVCIHVHTHKRARARARTHTHTHTTRARMQDTHTHIHIEIDR